MSWERKRRDLGTGKAFEDFALSVLWFQGIGTVPFRSLDNALRGENLA